MGADTKIEWARHTFNPWVGCTKLSPACDHCYAEAWAKRTGQAHLWAGERRRTTAANWREPLKWNRDAEAIGVRYRVFCASLADVFDNQADDQWRSDLFALIEDTPHLDWLLLTKRPQNVAKMIWPKWDAGLPQNIWLGTTVENQEEADRRIPHLLAAPAAIRFLSCEPLLGPVDLSMLHYDGVTNIDALRGRHGLSFGADCAKIDWVIAGGESGPGARPMHPDWARSLRDQCAAAGVPFFFKQWGEHAPYDRGRVDSALLATPKALDEPMGRFGKKLAGRVLDGRTHDAFPEAPHG
jgi:protein gp37